jgi:hypothetical protein
MRTEPASGPLAGSDARGAGPVCIRKPTWHALAIGAHRPLIRPTTRRAVSFLEFSWQS